MCARERVVNYLKAMLRDHRNSVLFVGYHSAGTPERAIRRFDPRSSWVDSDDDRIAIRCGVHTLGGYSAHADQTGLAPFACGTEAGPPREIRLVHGDDGAEGRWQRRLRLRCPRSGW